MTPLFRILALGGVLVLPWQGLLWPDSDAAPTGAAAAQDDDDDDGSGDDGGDDSGDDGSDDGGGDDGDDRPSPRPPSGGGNDDDAEDDDDDEDDRPRQPSGGEDNDDDDDDRPRPRQPSGGGDDDDDGDDDDRPRPRQPGGGDDDDDQPRPRQPSGGDDDDDDDNDDARPAQAPRQPAPRAPVEAPPPPTEAGGEIVALDLSADDVDALVAQGFVVIEERTIAELGTQTRRLAVPAGVTLEAARAQVRALPSGQDADFNHFYRTEQDVVPASAVGPVPGWAAPCDGLHCPAFDQIAWPVAPSREQVCGVPVDIGMIDTGLNEDHTTFEGATLEVTRLSDESLDPSRAVHGTAVAAILVGSPESRSPGLIPWSRLVAVDAFHRAGQDERADVVALIEGLGLLADEGVGVINLSLAGPPNTVLQEAIARLVTEEGIVIVAAAGNGGPRAEPAYPAAYDGVIAVTAVDYGDGVYRRAQQGDYVDLAAPGVEVWTAASVSGARSKTGTSFAVPFVTAAAALVLQGNPDLTPAEVEARLVGTARDLGDPGRDAVFGAGVVMAEGLCATGPVLPAMPPAAPVAAGVGPVAVAAPVPDSQDGAIEPAGAALSEETTAD